MERLASDSKYRAIDGRAALGHDLGGLDCEVRCRFGRFPRGRSELHSDPVEFVARQLGVGAGSVGFYEWSGRTFTRHRAEIRAHFGFRECTVADADDLAGWLASGYAQEERRYELVRDALLAELRSRSIEPPAPDRVERIVRSGLRQAEKTLVSRISGRLPGEVRARLLALVSADEGDGDSEADLGLLALIKAATGNVSLASMLTEVSRLEAVRAIGLPDGLFADVAPKVVAAWRSRAAVESPSHLRDPRSDPDMTVTLLAALVYSRSGRMTARTGRGPGFRREWLRGTPRCIRGAGGSLRQGMCGWVTGWPPQRLCALRRGGGCWPLPSTGCRLLVRDCLLAGRGSWRCWRRPRPRRRAATDRGWCWSRGRRASVSRPY